MGLTQTIKDRTFGNWRFIYRFFRSFNVSIYKNFLGNLYLLFVPRGTS